MRTDSIKNISLLWNQKGDKHPTISKHERSKPSDDINIDKSATKHSQFKLNTYSPNCAAPIMSPKRTVTKCHNRLPARQTKNLATVPVHFILWRRIAKMKGQYWRREKQVNSGGELKDARNSYFHLRSRQQVQMTGLLATASCYTCEVHAYQLAVGRSATLVKIPTSRCALFEATLYRRRKISYGYLL
jgi:hypothetical protein